MATSSFRLSSADQNTDCWRRLKAHYESRLATLRENNESMATTPEQRAQIVVRIDEIKRFLALAQPAPDKPAKAG